MTETPTMRLPLALAFAALLAAPPAAATVEIRRLTVDHDGLARVALIEAPADAAGAPVLVVLHGGISGVDWLRRRAGIRLAQEGWVVVWPSAVDDWNDGRRDRRGQPYAETDDVGFMRRLVATLEETDAIDPARVYFAGPSLGGTMVLRLLCDAPDLVAGAAVAIASLPVGLDCADGPPRPVLLLHGDADAIMPPEGGRIGGDSILIRERGRVRPIAETVDLLVSRNGCEGVRAEPLPDLAPDDGSTATRREYTGCAAPFVHYVVEGGGHTWPGSATPRMAGGLVGATNLDFSATRAVEAFFRRAAGL
jgi:polyhydroxybutyrate depolymerase